MMRPYRINSNDAYSPLPAKQDAAEHGNATSVAESGTYALYRPSVACALAR
jgi:hypothetical protein